MGTEPGHSHALGSEWPGVWSDIRSCDAQTERPGLCETIIIVV